MCALLFQEINPVEALGTRTVEGLKSYFFWLEKDKRRKKRGDKEKKEKKIFFLYTVLIGARRINEEGRKENFVIFYFPDICCKLGTFIKIYIQYNTIQ